MDNIIFRHAETTEHSICFSDQPRWEDPYDMHDLKNLDVIHEVSTSAVFNLNTFHRYGTLWIPAHGMLLRRRPRRPVSLVALVKNDGATLD